MSIAFSGCIGLRYLKEDEKLLYSQKIDNLGVLDFYEADAALAQHPNKKISGIISPYVYLYQFGERTYDTAKYQSKKKKIEHSYEKKINKKKKENKKDKLISKKNKKINQQELNIKEGNLMMRLGEPVSVFDSVKLDESVQNLTAFMKSEGFLTGSVHPYIKYRKSLAYVTYEMAPGKPYIMDSIRYSITDTTLSKIIIDKPILKKGRRFTEDGLSETREEIYYRLVNKGYYNFGKQYIHFGIDTTTLGDKKVAIDIAIDNPANGLHKMFYIDSIVFVLDANTIGGNRKRQVFPYKDISYLSYFDHYRKKQLDPRIVIRKDSAYSRNMTLETQRRLSTLDLFKFVNINYDTTSVKGYFLANIFTSPLKKFQTSFETGLSSRQGSLPGPFINITAKNRNAFRNLEILELQGNFGIEGLSNYTNSAQAYSSLEYGASINLRLPLFASPLPNQLQQRLFQMNPSTKLTAGLNFTDRISEFKRKSFVSSLTYLWQNGTKRNYQFTPIEINYIKSELSEDFKNTILETDSLQINSFRSSFITSLSGSTVFNIGNYGNLKTNSAYVKLFVESSGYMQPIFQEVPFEDLTYFQFVKFTGDFRYSSPRGNSGLAMRLNFGIAPPYGDNKSLPYEKYFFAGGSTSVRAWRPRRLGPGSYRQEDENGNLVTTIEQPGQMIIEGSIEWRKKMGTFIHTASFLDFGNIWNVVEDSREGAQFKFPGSLQDIAVGGGFGLRLDFSFLLLRIDAATRIYDPAKLQNEKWVWDNIEIFNFHTWKKESAINLGIGYPF